MFEIKQIHIYQSIASVESISYCASKRRMLLINHQYLVTDLIKLESQIIIVLLGNLNEAQSSSIILFT